jgi:hypothetical protein
MVTIQADIVMQDLWMLTSTRPHSGCVIMEMQEMIERLSAGQQKWM